MVPFGLAEYRSKNTSSTILITSSSQGEMLLLVIGKGGRVAARIAESRLLSEAELFLPAKRGVSDLISKVLQSNFIHQF